MSHLFSHSSYKLSTFSTIPQLSSSAKDFSGTETWPYLMKFLRQMNITGHYMEEQIQWNIQLKQPIHTQTNKILHSYEEAQRNVAQQIKPIVQLNEPSNSKSAEKSTPSSSNSSTNVASPSYCLPDSSLTISNQLVDSDTWYAAMSLDKRLSTQSSHSSKQLNHPTLSIQGRSTTKPGLPYSSSSSSSSSSASTTSSISTSVESDLDSLVSLSSHLNLRGLNVSSCDASMFLHPSLYTSFNPQPLQVTRHPSFIHGNKRQATLWRYVLLQIRLAVVFVLATLFVDFLCLTLVLALALALVLSLS